jgi:hypothetical protein
MPAPTIKEVSYRVKGGFGDAGEGDMRIAYRMGKDDGSDRVLLFHPKDKHGCGSLEFARVTRDSTNRMIPIYETDREQIKKDTFTDGKFLNLSPTDEKFYRAVVESAGLTILKNLVLSVAEPEPQRPRRRMR